MTSTSKKSSPYSHIPTFDEESGDLNVIIETPKGSRTKYDYEAEMGLFILGGVLPAGAVFPYDFGFVPGTRGGDGDPLDVLVITDESTFTGCLARARLIGVIEAEQTEQGKGTFRNDRLIAVASKSRDHADLQTLDDLTDTLLDEIEHFFVSYNDVKGKEFNPLGRGGPDRAKRVVEEGMGSVRGVGG